jgi:hypothetical protein
MDSKTREILGYIHASQHVLRRACSLVLKDSEHIGRRDNKRASRGLCRAACTVKKRAKIEGEYDEDKTKSERERKMKRER